MKKLLQPLIKWVFKKYHVNLSHKHTWKNTITHAKPDFSYMHEIFECENCNKMMHIIRRPLVKPTLKIMNKKTVDIDQNK